MNNVLLRLSTTLYGEAYTYINDTAMVTLMAFKAKNFAYQLHWLVNNV